MINIKNISYTYRDGQKALRNINLKINKNETIAIVGANGAGKSTLIKLLVGILKPEYGEIVIDDLKINKSNLKEIRKRVGVIFQNSDNMLFMNKVYDDIAFGPRNYNLQEDKIKEKVNEVMKNLNIEYLKDRTPNNLSSGEKRKVSIASVLAMNPSYIIFDEPTSFLDPKGRRILISVLQNLETTKIIATHDLEMVMKICSRVIVIKNGEIMGDGNPNEILNNFDLLNKWDLA